MTHPLLTPRYMVEADYPNSPFRVGDVLEYRNEIRPEFCDYSTGCSVSEHEAKDYLHIFRPMHWSEGRSLDEMPRYLRRKEGVIHVQQYYSKDTGLFVSTLHGSTSYPIEWYTPATEAEYLEYLKSQEK